MHKLPDALIANDNKFQQVVYLNTLVSRPRSGSVVIRIWYVGAVCGQIGFVHIPIVILEIGIIFHKQIIKLLTWARSSWLNLETSTADR